MSGSDEAMRDIVLFIDVPDFDSTAMYHQAARCLGLVPVVVSQSPSGRVNVAASDSVQMARMDIASILAAIDRMGRERIAGVFASGSAAAEFAARLAAAIDRPHADPGAISLCNDKYRLRAFLERRGLDTVACRHVATMAEASTAVEALGGAVVVKPISSTGSHGVRVCRTPGEALSHVQRLLKWKHADILIEKFIEAPQYSVEFFDGIPLSVKRNYFTGGPFPIMTGVEAPARLPQKNIADIKTYAGSIIKAVGLTDGPAFVELRSSEENIHLIEINPRPSLDSPIVISTATGLDMADLCMKFCCGIPYDRNFIAKETNRRACAGRFLIRDGSTVRALQGVDAAKEVPHVKAIQVHCSDFCFRRGPATSALDRIAAIYSDADQIDLAIASADAAKSRIAIIYDSFPRSLIRFYAHKIHRLWVKLSRSCSLLLNKSGGLIVRP